MRLEHLSETNDFGLVPTPKPDNFTYFNLTEPQRKRRRIQRHHLYWPYDLYHSSDLYADLRKHRLNTIWIHRRDHVRIHRDNDGVSLPPKDVAEAFREEADAFDDLDKHIFAVKAIYDSFREGRVRRISSTKGNLDEHLEKLQQTLERFQPFELLTSTLAVIAVEQAVELVANAETHIELARAA